MSKTEKKKGRKGQVSKDCTAKCLGCVFCLFIYRDGRKTVSREGVDGAGSLQENRVRKREFLTLLWPLPPLMFCHVVVKQ